MTSKYITVMPVTQGVGCKFITTAFAHGLKQQDPSKKIVVLDFDFYEPYLAEILTSMDKEHCIDNLIDKIDSGVLTEELFAINLVKVDKTFDVLKGTKMDGKPYIFTQEHIDTILEMVELKYDYCVMAVSPFNDNAGTIFGLWHADKVILVSELNSECRAKFGNAVDMATMYTKPDTSLYVVYNKRTKDYDLDFTQEQNQFPKLQVAGSIPFLPYAVDNQNLKTGIFNKALSKMKSDYPIIIKTVVDNIILPGKNIK